ncbi:ADAMTS-like protein 5 [Protopterus annectens]|uniref:ADAMTS-like protein 5 n=1 Tax=Protopterus annectens TaxID=7888 RepID=UPI001CFBC267|nr:ADAMTS-like protein 5 [Protopterus annectens]
MKRSECPVGSVDFRALQCSLYSNKPVLGSQEQYQWFPFYGATNPCDLNCIALGYNFYYTFGKVLDGTRCSTDSEGLCINGQCLEAGCDGILGSNVQADVCGHCGGKNDTCIFIQRIYQDYSTVSGFFGYKNVTRIPVGATLVKVTDQSKNYLAMMDSEQNFLINGNWAIDWPGEYEAAGTMIHYRRSADSHETLEVTGPTLQDLYLMVLLQEPNPGIKYEYWLPNESPSNVQGDASPLHQYDTDGRPVYTSTNPDESATVKPLMATRTESQPDFCSRCKQPKGKSQRIREYCHSDFVFRVKIVGKKITGQETRYDVQVKYTYKNNYHVTHREYVWVSNICDCPRIIEQYEYLMMAQRHVNFEHTLNRILLRHNSYVKLWSPREDMYLRSIGKHCHPVK